MNVIFYFGGGASIVSTFFFFLAVGQSNWLIAKERKKDLDL
jgi:hypothetical protein